MKTFQREAYVCIEITPELAFKDLVRLTEQIFQHVNETQQAEPFQETAIDQRLAIA